MTLLTNYVTTRYYTTVIISNKKFGLQLGLLLVCISVFDFIFVQSNFRFIILFTGLFLVLCALFAEPLLTPIKFVWLKISILLAIVCNPIILSTIFVFIFIPVGLIMKLFKRDFLLIKSDNVTTYKNVLGENSINFERQF